MHFTACCLLGNPKIDHINIKPIYKKIYPKLYDEIIYKIRNDERYNSLIDNFHDFRYIFDNDEYVYYDEAHISPNGNIQVVKEINNFLKK